MKVVHVSQAQAQQRSGRAGREAPGTCYRMYTQQQYEAFRKSTVPEIQRCDIVEALVDRFSFSGHFLDH